MNPHATIMMTRTNADGTQETFPLSEIECQWFALCSNPSDTFLDHPILGDVPICKRCFEKIETLSR